MTVNQNVNASNLLLVRSQTTQTTPTDNGKNPDATGFADVLANSSRKVSAQESNADVKKDNADLDVKQPTDDVKQAHKMTERHTEDGSAESKAVENDTEISNPAVDDDISKENLEQAVKLINKAKRPMVFVGGGACGASYGACGVVECHAFSGEEFHELFFLEPLVLSVHEVVFVVEEQETEDPPHVVDEVRIEEVHTPSLLRRRKTSEHQQPCAFGQEWLQRVVFYYSAVVFVSHSCILSLFCTSSLRFLFLLLCQIHYYGQVVAVSVEPYSSGMCALWCSFVFAFALYEIVAHEDVVVEVFQCREVLLSLLVEQVRCHHDLVEEIP